MAGESWALQGSDKGTTLPTAWVGGNLRFQGCAESTPEGSPPFFSQGLQEPGGKGRGLRPVSRGMRAEEVQVVPGVKVMRVP